MTLPPDWRRGEVAVIGLARSGSAVARLLAREGIRVYASDVATEGLDDTVAKMRASGVDVQTGGHDLARIGKAALVVASPGIPPEAPPMQAARSNKVPLVGEMEVALRALPGLRYVAVTGTNGKTTTTSLIGHLFRALGHDAVEAGNIGTPLAELALERRMPAWVALEISSFQLHDAPSIAPTVGVVTNLSGNHLDRYDSIDGYFGDKALLFRNMRAESRWVLNADDAEVMRLHERLPGSPRALEGEAYLFSLARRDTHGWFDRPREALMALDEPLLPRSELVLVGDHNVANALAAALAVMVADPGHRTPEARRRIAEGLRSFRAIEHRIEPVAEVKGVQWINDSKSTNVASTVVALQGMTRPTVLLLGGRHKGEPYTALAAELRRIGGRVIAYGESASIVEKDLGQLIQVDRLGDDFEAVVERAAKLARPGDAVLLSPACSSYDMFDNYEQRGREFKRLVRERAAP